MTIELSDEKIHNNSVEEISKVIIKRLGLGPRKIDSQIPINNLLIEFYERTKKATQEKNPEFAIMTIDEIKDILNLTRQTSYDYINRWLEVRIITKMSYSKNGKIIKGYKLNGISLENAFLKTVSTIKEILDETNDLIHELQKNIKNEKIRNTLKNKDN
ncbi:MAG: hypothetical protein PHT94_02330 [Candidatus Nanoarchaeia archaeon]|nr:hypothetical protein [Candidatus Nanoarchaeia archaeon]